MPNPTKAIATPPGQPTKHPVMTDAETAARRAQEQASVAAAIALDERTVTVVVDDGIVKATTEEMELQQKPDAADLAAVKQRIALRDGVDELKVDVTVKRA